MSTKRAERLLERAFAFSAKAHEGQVRKGTDIPYVSHPMSVAGLVLEDAGGLEDAAAALLHDVVEDTDVTLADLRSAFGPNIARLVEGCTDSLEAGEKAPWRERKEAYLARLVSEPPEVLRISVADKLHNARSILEDARRDGPRTLDRFSGRPMARSDTTAPWSSRTSRSGRHLGGYQSSTVWSTNYTTRCARRLRKAGGRASCNSPLTFSLREVSSIREPRGSAHSRAHCGSRHRNTMTGFGPPNEANRRLNGPFDQHSPPISVLFGLWYDGSGARASLRAHRLRGPLEFCAGLA